MSHNMRCEHCGKLVTEEITGTETQPSRPCLTCGFTKFITLEFFSLPADVQISRAQRDLPTSESAEEQLTQAGDCVARGALCTAVILAHAACDRMFSAALSHAFHLRAVPELEPLIIDERGRTPASPQSLAIYEALSKDIISQANFWPHFLKSRKHRNKLIKGTHITDPTLADQAYSVAIEFINHIKSRITLSKNPQHNQVTDVAETTSPEAVPEAAQPDADHASIPIAAAA